MWHRICVSTTSRAKFMKDFLVWPWLLANSEVMQMLHTTKMWGHWRYPIVIRIMGLYYVQTPTKSIRSRNSLQNSS